MSTRQPDASGRELSEFARARNVDGVLMTARCFVVENPSRHYEILLAGIDEVAIVDVPASEHHALAHLVEQALESFIAGHHGNVHANEP